MRALGKNVFRVLLLAVVFPLVAGGAHAGVGDRVGEAVYWWKSSSPIEKAQYFSFDDEDYCWYDDGWHGPGWYWCGYESSNGYGWGGPYGWNGWGGGYYIRRHGPHRVGVWHPGPPGRRLGAGGPPAAPGLRGAEAPASRHFGAAGAPARPGLNGGLAGYPALQSDGGPAFHGAQNGGSFHGYDAPAAHGFQAGGAPAPHSFGGGGYQGFGGGGGFHGGGGLQGFGGGGFHGGGAFAGGHR
jgi:hypothetical protein